MLSIRKQCEDAADLNFSGPGENVIDISRINHTFGKIALALRHFFAQIQETLLYLNLVNINAYRKILMKTNSKIIYPLTKDNNRQYILASKIVLFFFFLTMLSEGKASNSADYSHKYHGKVKFWYFR